jgi:hypothetical protein
VVGIEDAVHGYLAHEMFQLRQCELEHQARRQRLISLAVRARRRNRKAVREVRRLRLATERVPFAEKKSAGDASGAQPRASSMRH